MLDDVNFLMGDQNSCVSTVADCFGATYQVFKKPVNIGSVVKFRVRHEDPSGVLSNTDSLSNTGFSIQYFFIVRPVKRRVVSELFRRYKGKIKLPLSKGLWYEVLSE